MDSWFSPGFWDREWANFRALNAGNISKRTSQSEYWDGRAEDFARSTIHSANKSARIDKVFNYLRSFDILQPGIKILDIGSGPGSFAIPLAALGYDVVALDPSPKMLEILRSNISPGLPGNITAVEGLWEEIDIHQMGWNDNFDLVFASMCPGIHDRNALEKMMFCSKEWCYLSAFSGSRKFPIYDEILSKLFNRKYGNHFNDVIFPFNLLYSLGFQPSITFWNNRTRHPQELGQVKSEILDIANSIASVNPEMEAVIDEIIDEHAIDGKVQQQVTSSVGMIVWRKQIAYPQPD